MVALIIRCKVGRRLLAKAAQGAYAVLVSQCHQSSPRCRSMVSSTDHRPILYHGWSRPRMRLGSDIKSPYSSSRKKALFANNYVSDTILHHGPETVTDHRAGNSHPKADGNTPVIVGQSQSCDAFFFCERQSGAASQCSCSARAVLYPRLLYGTAGFG